MKRTLLTAGMAFAAMGSAMAAQATPQAPQAVQQVQKQTIRSERPRVTKNQKRRTLRSYFETPMLYGRKMTSTRTVAQDKRQARKRRNKAR